MKKSWAIVSKAAQNRERADFFPFVLVLNSSFRFHCLSRLCVCVHFILFYLFKHVLNFFFFLKFSQFSVSVLFLFPPRLLRASVCVYFSTR